MRYAELVDVYENLEKTSARLKKTEIIADFLAGVSPELLPKVTLLIQGLVFPQWSEREVGIARQLAIKIISSSTGHPENDVIKRFKDIGDLGLVIEDFVSRKKQKTLFSKPLEVGKVFENLQQLAFTEGKGSQERKSQLVSELISSAKPKEAKYIIRNVVGDLRIGVADGVVRDAIAKAFFPDFMWLAGGRNERMEELINKVEKRSFIIQEGLLMELMQKKRIDHKFAQRFMEKNSVKEISIEEIKSMTWERKHVDYVFLIDNSIGSEIKKELVSAVEWAWFIVSDYGEVARIASEKGLKGLKGISLEPGRPFHVLLGEKAPSLEDAINSFDNVAIEYKYDGARVQIHKKGEKVWLFTRSLENITAQFPEIVKMMRECVKARECIIEGEILAINPKTRRPEPFQLLSQRIHRKYEIERLSGDIPVQVNLFDIVYVNGKNFFDMEFSERRRRMEENVKISPGKFQLAKQIVTKDIKEAQRFYKEALDNNQEGVFVKNLDAKYQPGRRVAGGWLKVKPIMETLDLAIIGGTWGTGKRAGWLSSLVLGVRDEESGEFLECGRMGTGMKEKGEEGVSFEELTRMLEGHITEEKGSDVVISPRIVVEIAYEEIQKSPNYASGYALRFPRIVRLREDKPISETDTTERLGQLYRMQFGKPSKQFKN